MGFRTPSDLENSLFDNKNNLQLPPPVTYEPFSKNTEIICNVTISNLAPPLDNGMLKENYISLSTHTLLFFGLPRSGNGAYEFTLVRPS